MTSNDEKFLREALEEGASALARGDYPVGAALVINGDIVGKLNNSSLSKGTWGDHAETQLLLKYSQQLRELQRENPKTIVELYVTLEPCMMCLGCAALHRVNKVVFACPDPRGGATNVVRDNLPSFYHDKWPTIEGGILKEEAYKMFITWMEHQHTEPWRRNKKLFENMATAWE